MDQTSEKEPTCPNSKKKAKYKYILWTAVLLLILAFVVSGIVTDWFGLYGPASKISIAGAKTFIAQNFSADFEISTGKLYVEGILQLNIDQDNETIEVYLEAVSGKTVYIAAIYDSKLIYGTQKHLFSKDIGPQLENYFRKSDKKSAKIRSIDDALDLLFNIIPEDLQQKINESYLDLDETKDLLKSFLFTKLNRTSWLKEHAAYKTYRVDGVQYHTFRTEKGELLSDMLEHFESAFISEKLHNQLQQSAEAIQQSDSSTETLFAIDDGFLCKFESITRSPNKTSYITVEFHSIGATKIDYEQLSELLQKTKS